MELHTTKRKKTKTLEDQAKKKDILERNRASSMRARAKRKAWIQQLERTVSNVNETNVALQMEIKVLRTEVAKLKALLLAHKDCPITKATQKCNIPIVFFIELCCTFHFFNINSYILCLQVVA